MQQHDIHIILSGGGTGGHIFPAIAIADALKKKLPVADILFVGALGKMEMELVPKAGYKIKGLWISGLQRKPSLKNLSFPFKLINSLYLANKILKKFRPQLVIGTGGYASGPLLNRAIHMGIPAVIQEQNSYPGITNKLLSRKVNTICVAYKGMDKFFPKEKLVITGNPVRKSISGSIVSPVNKTEALNYFGLQAGKTTVLVIGGSLGALTINESIFKNLHRFKKENLQVLWQTGKSFYDTAFAATQEYALHGIRAFEFIHRMELAYTAADIVVSRAGAIAISELCILRKPCIFIPSPNVAEDHQTKNAQALVEKKAALMVKDSDARTNLFDTLIDLVTDHAKMKRMSENIGHMGIPDADERIADEAIKLLSI